MRTISINMFFVKHFTLGIKPFVLMYFKIVDDLGSWEHSGT